MHLTHRCLCNVEEIGQVQKHLMLRQKCLEASYIVDKESFLLTECVYCGYLAAILVTMPKNILLA